MNNKHLIIFNAFDFGSTGVLCNYLKESAQDGFVKPIFICSNKPKNRSADYYLHDHCSKLYRKIQSIIAELFNLYGFVGRRITRRALRFAEKRLSSDNELVISIHQIESSIFDLKSLLGFAAKRNAQIFITIHDCWFFTGKCPYFDISKCDQWKTGCNICPNKRDFPSTKFKNIKSSYRRKIKLINKYKDLITFVCPSQWIANRLQESALNNIKHVVVYNGIKIVESPNESQKQTKIGLIAVASPWSERKGLKFMKFLSNHIDYERYSITVIGIEDAGGFSDKTSLYKTISRDQLFLEFAKNDYFINPTLEDNFPTTNIEALSCGLKIVSFNTGGSCESFDEFTGYSIEDKSEIGLLNAVLQLDKNTNKSACINRAKMYFSKDIFVAKYYNLFRGKNEKKV